MIIQLAYVFTAKSFDIPNFVVFRGSLPPGLPLNENWVDNFDAKTKEEYITIDYADEKGNLENIFSRKGCKIAFILILQGSPDCVFQEILVESK